MSRSVKTFCGRCACPGHNAAGCEHAFEPFTSKEIRAQVRHIGEISGDFEDAHGLEDKLYERVLIAIARGDADPMQLAREALQTKRFDFKRECA